MAADRPDRKRSSPAAPSEAALNRLFLAVLFVLPFLLYEQFLTGSRMIFGSDFIGAGTFAMRQFMADYLARHHGFALWIPYMYGGMPTVASFFADMFYPPSVLLRSFLPVHVAWTYTFILQVFVGGLGTYLFLKQLKIPQPAAFVMAVAYMFCGSLVSTTYEGHDGRLIVISLLPMVLFFLERGIQSARLIDFLLAGTVFGLQLLSPQVQSAYYSALASVIYFGFRFIARLWDDRRAGIPIRPGFRLVVWFGLMLAFAGGLAAIQYLPVFGSLSSGVRGSNHGYAFATSWSMPPEETFDLVSASFSGGLDRYWGRNLFKHHTEYLGILPLILALIGIVFTWRERRTKFFLGLLLFALLMAWGGHTPFYRIPYRLLPGVAKFRAPSLIFFVGAFSMIVLGGFGLKHLLDGVEAGATSSRRMTWFLAVVAVAGMALPALAAVGRGLVVPLLSSVSRSPAGRVSANYGSFLNGTVVAAMLVLVNVALIFLLSRRRLRVLPFCMVATLVLLVDLWSVDARYIAPYPPPAETFKADEVISFLKQDAGLYRVFPAIYRDTESGMSRSDEGMLMAHGIQNIGGQHPNPSASYMDFAGLKPDAMFNLPPNLACRRFLDLLNTKYIILSPPNPGVATDSAYNRYREEMLEQYVTQPGINLAWASPRAAIFRNDSMLPRAFMAPDYQVLKDDSELLARVKSPGFDPRRIVLLSSDPVGARHASDSTTAGPGEASVKTFDANRVVVEAAVTRAGFLVLSENYHPDWKARDNGKPVKIERAFLTLRAVYLTPGTHTVEFRYESKYFRAGALISALALVFLAFAGGSSIVSSRRKTQPPTTRAHAD